VITELKRDLKKVEEALRREVASGHEIVLSAEKEKTDLLCAKLLLLSAKFGNYDFKKLLPAALAVEFFNFAFKKHYSHQPRQRRAGITAISHQQTNFSLIIGDFYYAKAISLASSLNNVRAIDILAQTILSFARGNSEKLSVAERLRESAVLYQTSCWLGTLISGADEKVVETLKAYGINLGMFYEIKKRSNDTAETYKNNILKTLRLLPENDAKKELQLLIPD